MLYISRELSKCASAANIYPAIPLYQHVAQAVVF